MSTPANNTGANEPQRLTVADTMAAIHIANGRGDVVRRRQAAERALTAADFIAQNKPAGYAAVDGGRTFEPMDAAYWLRHFSDWVQEQYEENQQSLLFGRHYMKATAVQAGSDFDSGKTLAESKVLRDWVNDALYCAQCEEEEPDLQQLQVMARQGGDLMGHFDFKKRLVRQWFERFLGLSGMRRHWEASGVSIADLRAIQSPKTRQQQGIRIK